MKQQTCKECGSIYHTKMYHKPKTPIKRTAIKNKVTLKDIVYQSTYDKHPELKKKPRKKKPTIVQIKKKLALGGTLTQVEKKIQYNYQLDKAWKAFSTYIRHRDCLATTGTFERGQCVTCIVRGDYTEYPYARIQAGHAVGGRRNAVLFHEEIVNGQCDHDNRQGHGGLAGDYGNYMIHLVRKYGLAHAEYLQSLKYAYKNYTYDDLVQVEQEFKDKLEELKRNDKYI